LNNIIDWSKYTHQQNLYGFHSRRLLQPNWILPRIQELQKNFARILYAPAESKWLIIMSVINISFSPIFCLLQDEQNSLEILLQFLNSNHNFNNVMGRESYKSSAVSVETNFCWEIKKAQQNFDRILLYSAPFKWPSFVFRLINQKSVKILLTSLIAKHNITTTNETAVRSTPIIQAKFLINSLIWHNRILLIQADFCYSSVKTLSFSKKWQKENC
jgi:hypothetical protein